MVVEKAWRKRKFMEKKILESSHVSVLRDLGAIVFVSKKKKKL